jgi:hypothetical protein
MSNDAVNTETTCIWIVHEWRGGRNIHDFDCAGAYTDLQAARRHIAEFIERYGGAWSIMDDGELVDVVTKDAKRARIIFWGGTYPDPILRYCKFNEREQHPSPPRGTPPTPDPPWYESIAQVLLGVIASFILLPYAVAVVMVAVVRACG